MSGINGCYSCSNTPCYNDSLLHDNDCKGSWLLPVLIIFAALFFAGSFSWLLIILGIVLFFGKELLELIF